MATTAEYGLGEFTFPRGWFMVAEASQVGKAPHSVRFFGEDMVIYRGESGQPYMVSAYCPHMNSHIGKSSTSFMAQQGKQIEGESIHCPYHGWRYGPDGMCNKIPYSDKIPPQAKLTSYPVVERYGVIFHWHDPEGGAPDYDLPALPEWDNPHYVRWEIDHLGSMDLHPIEVVDNIGDVQHLAPVHATTKFYYFETILTGHIAQQLLGGKHELLGADAGMSEFNTYYTGPGILISRYVANNANDSIMFICHTPIDDGKLAVFHAVLSNPADRVPTEEDIVAAKVQQQMSCDAFAQDFEIWSNKRPCFRPMQMPGDGNFLKVRTWYRQFYNPRSETAAILARSEGRFVVAGIPNAEEGGARSEILESVFS